HGENADLRQSGAHSGIINSMGFDCCGKKNCLRGGWGRAKPRYARAIRSMQRERCKGKKKAERIREFPRRLQYLSPFLHSIRENLAIFVTLPHPNEVFLPEPWCPSWLTEGSSERL